MRGRVKNTGSDTRRWGGRGLVAVCAAVILSAGFESPLVAQPSRTIAARTSGPRMATRPELTALLDSLQNAYSMIRDNEQRGTVMTSIATIGRRLREGDVHPGDVVSLRVTNETRWTTDFTVTPTRTIELESIDPIDLSSVLHVEVEETIARHLARYLREPRIQVDVLKRIGVTGFVQNPGFYTITGTSLVSDAIMLAGGPGAGGNVSKIQFRRLGTRLDIGEQVVWQSMSLDDLGVQSGDEMYVPQAGSSFGRALLVGLGILATVTFIAIRLF